MEGSVAVVVGVDRFELPVDDPVLLDAVAGVEFEFEFFVALVVLIAGGEDFDDEFGGAGEVAGVVDAVGEAILADPDDVGDDGVGGGEDDAGGLEGLAEACGFGPEFEPGVEFAGCALVADVGGAGHVEFSIDNFMALPAVVGNDG